MRKSNLLKIGMGLAVVFLLMPDVGFSESPGPIRAEPTDAFWNIKVENCVFYGPAWYKAGEDRNPYSGNKREYTIQFDWMESPMTLEELETILREMNSRPKGEVSRLSE